MDNAGNCNTTATETGVLLASFRGAASRTRCFPHIVNLIAKANVHFLLLQGKAKVSAGTKRKRGQRVGAPEPAAAPLDPFLEAMQADATDTTLVEGENLTPEEEQLAEATEETVSLEDDGQHAHDENVVKTLRDVAIAQMRAIDVTFSSEDEKCALSIFPKVAGLARRVHDSPTLGEEFDRLVANDTSLATDQRRLARRVPTRWNSDLACLKSHVELRKAVEQLTGDRTLGLTAFRLTDAQWELVDDLMEVLPLFDGPTLLFSKTETPLITEAVPMLQDLEKSLKQVREAEDVKPIVRVAAHASILLAQKYHSLTNECEVYRISIVMCPNKKLQWFRDENWSEEAVEEVRQLVILRWEENYMPRDGASVAPTPPASSAVCFAFVRACDMSNCVLGQPTSRFMTPRRPSATYRNPDSIRTYLDDPLVSDEDIEMAGGLMQYWYRSEEHRPHLAAMASDFCSAPCKYYLYQLYRT
ncbi:hypothetical protein FA95DRAFT_1543462 [Auriscalpium vulgare]|uniref:Uncharacterized protein n=1 Tax=Auriscalpium vulgare TaxID=40419 RepID=A0ACB8RQ15_9AGAM|nr:hypothetical protein FA95DRAFT_1543462 [Auriscalpium vulgare]